ncbi:MAG: flagellar protein FlgN [Pseudomonadota bacterium]
MTADLVDAMISLTALMEEESDRLSRAPYMADLPEIAAAKLRLAGRIDAEVARLKRERPDWQDRLPEEERRKLADASVALRDASKINADVLSRQIQLSVEMMSAIAAEAQRLTGTRNTIYDKLGGLDGVDAPAPISINARL